MLVVLEAAVGLLPMRRRFQGLTGCFSSEAGQAGFNHARLIQIHSNVYWDIQLLSWYQPAGKDRFVTYVSLQIPKRLARA